MQTIDCLSLNKWRNIIVYGVLGHIKSVEDGCGAERK